MAINSMNEISNTILTVAALGVVAIGVSMAVMRIRQKYQPTLIGALVGALLCFLLLETLPAFN
jgi:hypothetical protein